MQEESSATILEAEKETQLSLATKNSRLVAFVLDIVLIGTFVGMIIMTVIIPHFHPGTSTELRKLVEMYASSPEMTQDQLADQFSPELIDMFQSCQAFTVFGIWFYFALSEIFMKGASIGKRTLSIHVINRRTLAPPGIFDAILRSGLKTLALLAFFPILIVSFLLIFITKENRTGHDLLTRTLVINDNPELEKTYKG